MFELGLAELAMVAVGIFLVLHGLRFASVAMSIGTAVFQRSGYRHIRSQDVPEHIPDFIRPVVERLRALGFDSRAWISIRHLSAGEPSQTVSLLMYNEERATWVAVGPRETPERLDPIDVSFWTIFQNGHIIYGLNGQAHALVRPIPDTTVIDPYEASVEAQWRAMLPAIDAYATAVPPRRLDIQGALQALEAQVDLYVDVLLETRVLKVADGTPFFTMSGIAAARLAWRMIRTARLRTGFLRARLALLGADPTAWPEPPLQEEQRAVDHSRSESKPKLPKKRRGFVFGITGALFAASMYAYVDNGIDILSLVAIIFLHELGHYGAMRFFGYRDTSIFFIPFLGAAATGQKRDATLSQEMIILLAGPVPGIALAILLRAWFPDLPAGHPLHAAIFMLIAINLFNLLPFTPLDGGRVVHALLFSRRPRAGVVFKVFAVLSFAVIGLAVGDPIVLFIAVIISFAIPSGYRTANMEAVIRRGVPPEVLAERPAPHVLAALRAADPSFGFAQKLHLLTQLEPRLRHAPLGLWTALPWLGAYGACVAMGVGAMMLALRTTQFAHQDAEQPSPTFETTGIVVESCDGRAARASRARHVLFVCETESEAAASSLGEQLAAQQMLHMQFCARAPWESAVESTEVRAAQRRARASLMAAIKAERVAYERAQAGAEAPVTEEEWGSAEAETRRARDAVLEALVRAYAHRPDLDAVTVELYRGLRPGEWRDQKLARRIGERLGLSDRAEACFSGDWDEESQRIFHVHAVEGRRAQIAMTLGSAAPSPETLARALCSNVCQKIGYAVSDRPFEPKR